VLVSKKQQHHAGANGIDDAVRLFLPTGELATGLLQGTHSVNKTVKFGNMTALVGLASINVSGLASLSSFHVFEAMGPHTLRSIVTLSGALLLSLDAFAHAHAHMHMSQLQLRALSTITPSYASLRLRTHAHVLLHSLG
jgi:hypothetical protein